MVYTSLPAQEPRLKYNILDQEILILSKSPVFKFSPTPIHTLWLILEKVSDPRKAQGKRYPLAIILTLAILAICCGHTSYQAMSEWADNYQEDLEEQLPFLAGYRPCKSTFFRVFSGLNTEELEDILGSWLQSITYLEKYEALSIDGKTNKNTDLHMLAVFAHQAKTVLFQKSTTSKGKELVVAPQLLSQIDLTDKIVTGDALFPTKKLCLDITQAGGGYVFTVKDNHRTLKEGIKVYFEQRSIHDKIETVNTLDGHKGRVEERTYEIASDPELLEYLDWPGLTHVWRCTRQTTCKKTGQVSIQVAYGIANFLGLINPNDQAQVIRGHWQIENNLHRKRDVNFNEDRSAIRTQSGPQVMSALVNIVISLFHQAQVKAFPTASRRFAAKPKELFAFLGLYHQNHFALQTA